MCFAVGRAAAHGSSYAGSVLRVDPIHVERDVISSGSPTGHAESFFDHSAHAALVDVAHGEDADAGLVNVLFLDGVNITHTDQHTILRPHLGREVVDVRQITGPEPHQQSERHGVYIAAPG